jgi:hypothetical protein
MDFVPIIRSVKEMDKGIFTNGKMTFAGLNYNDFPLDMP